jgi:hypothetical protein
VILDALAALALARAWFISTVALGFIVFYVTVHIDQEIITEK